MSPQVSEEDWNNDEQLVYLTYREMAVLTMMMNEFLPCDDGILGGILEGVKAKFMVELRPALYDTDLEKLDAE